MFSSILSNFLNAAAIVIHYGLTLYMWIIIARAVLSWVNPDPYNPIVRFVHNATEPLLHRIREKIPVMISGMDFSPIIVILAIIFLQKFIVGSLLTVSRQLLIG